MAYPMYNSTDHTSIRDKSKLNPNAKIVSVNREAVGRKAASGIRTNAVFDDGGYVYLSYGREKSCNSSHFIETSEDAYLYREMMKWENVVQYDVEWSKAVGLLSDGTVVATGFNVDGQCDVSDWTGIVAVSTTGNRTYGVKADGKIIVTGECSNDPELEKWF